MSMERPDDSTSSVEDEDEDKYEDDLQTLIPQNQPPSSIEIATNLAAAAAAAARRFSSHKRYYLFALSLPLLLLLLYLSATSAPFLHSPTPSPSPSPSDRLLESQLQALFLLKSQQSSLLTLLNHTTSNATSLDDQDFRSALLDQIRTNRQIQKALLSSHRPRNLNSTDNVGPDLDNYELDACKKVEWPADRKTIEWKPNNKDRFLFAVCVSGQMSNHLICLEKHMFFAALLDRVLVFPSHKVDYRYDEVLDLKRINECFGREVVVSFDEFVERRKGSGKVRIDRFICYMASPPCFLDEEHVKRLKELGVGLGRIEAAWPEDGKLKVQKKRVVEDVMPKFSADAEVIAIGDMFYADVEEEWVMQPGGPLKHKCRTLIQPSRLIILTAQRFVQTFLGNNFIALHFRRHGFLKFCNMKEESCFFPIPQAAECILQVVAKSNAPVIYLSTDAAESETDLLQSLLVPNDNNKKIPLVKRPNHNSAEKWDALLYRNRLGGNNQVEAMLDKTICAMSNVFIGASGSTFTEDIIRLRRGWGSSSKCDGYLCQGERPNFIAENE